MLVYLDEASLSSTRKDALKALHYYLDLNEYVRAIHSECAFDCWLACVRQGGGRHHLEHRARQGEGRTVLAITAFGGERGRAGGRLTSVRLPRATDGLIDARAWSDGFH